MIWQWDTSQADNNTGVHPGKGLVLPIDAHPKAEKWGDGTLMRNRIQSFDSSFSRYRTDAVTLHKDGAAKKIAGRAGVPVFDDGHWVSYYDPSNPTGSVKVTDTNTRIEIVKEPKSGETITVQVGPQQN